MITLPFEGWMADAACPETDPEAFFPEGSTRGLDAKRVCRLCAVAAECLAFALEHGETGVWGGTNDADRRRIRREAASV